MQQIVDTRGSIRFFPAVGQVRFVIWPNDARVCGSDEPGLRIERLWQLLEGNVAGPFGIVCIPAFGDFAMSFLSNRHARRHDVPNVAIHIRIDRVLSRSPHALHHIAKLLPVVRLAKPVVAVGKPAWFRGGPAHGIGLIAVTMNDWAMTRDWD